MEKRPYIRQMRREDDRRCRFKDSDIADMKTQYERGTSISQIAKNFNTSYCAIYYHVSQKRRDDVLTYSRRSVRTPFPKEYYREIVKRRKEVLSHATEK